MSYKTDMPFSTANFECPYHLLWGVAKKVSNIYLAAEVQFIKYNMGTKHKVSLSAYSPTKIGTIFFKQPTYLMPNKINIWKKSSFIF